MNSHSNADSHLLFGLLALQNGLISREQLVAAFAKWTDDKSVPLDQVLVTDKALDAAAAETLRQLVMLQVQRHQGDPLQTLVTLSGSDLSAAKKDLAQLEDADLQKSMAALPDSDTIATRMPALGQATSEGSRFRILRPLPGARGGMGIISIAQDEELGRQVALKQILSDRADHPAYRQKFQVEAEVTGNLEHPGIVPIYGLGVGNDGRPYYAMRLVHGDNLAAQIKEFYASAVDYNSVEFHGLVDRLIDVAQAVRYAHSRGVLHRDLKPGNILVGEYGETLVIDWGLARLPQTEDRGSEDSASGTLESHPRLQIRSGTNVDATLQGQILGTVGYAPPEQLNGRVDLITERSDVYALGAILYQILVGQAPVTSAESNLDDVIKDTIAGRITPPRRVRRAIPKSLSAVSMRSLERDPMERYGSVEAFIAELERWKADQPVEAAPDTIADRVMRLARRYRAAALATGAALLGIAIVAGVALFVVNRARVNESAARDKAEQLAIEKTQLAEEKTELANRNQTVVDAFVAAFRSADPENEGVTSKMTALEVLEQAVAEIESDEELAKNQLAKATLLHAIGDSLVSLGAHEQAIKAHQEALRLRSAKLGDDDPDTLTTMNELATAYYDAGRLDESLSLLEEALRRRRAKHGDDHPDTLMSLNNLASAYDAAGRLSEALPIYEETLKRTRAALGDDHADTLRSMNNLATGYYAAGRLDEALSILQELLRVAETTLGTDHPHTLMTMNNLAYGYNATGRFEDSLPLLQETLRRQKAKLGDDHPDVLKTRNNIAYAYMETDRIEEALSLYEETLRMTKAKLGDEHPDTLKSMNNLASGYFAAGRLEEALPLLAETLQLKKIKLGDEHPSTLRSMGNLASIYYSAGRLEEALPLYQETQRLREAKLGRDHPDTLYSMERLAAALIRKRDFEAAEPIVADWIKRLGAQEQPSSRARAETMRAVCLLELGQIAEATNAVKTALQIDEIDDLLRLRAESVAASGLAAQKDAAAEAQLVKAYQELRKRLTEIKQHERWWVARACERVVALHKAAEHTDLVEEWENELADVNAEIARLRNPK